MEPLKRFFFLEIGAALVVCVEHSCLSKAGVFAELLRGLAVHSFLVLESKENWEQRRGGCCMLSGDGSASQQMPMLLNSGFQIAEKGSAFLFLCIHIFVFI